MRRRHTKKTDQELAGPTVQRPVRLPEVQLRAVLAAISAGLPDIHTLTDAVVDALWLWLYENQRSNGTPPALPQTRAEAEAQMDAQWNSEGAEPTEADRAYTGTHERPSWRDVDVSAFADLQDKPIGA